MSGIQRLQTELNRANQRARNAETRARNADARAAVLQAEAENAESVVCAHQTSIGMLGQLLPANLRQERHFYRTGIFLY